MDGTITGSNHDLKDTVVDRETEETEERNTGSSQRPRRHHPSRQRVNGESAEERNTGSSTGSQDLNNTSTIDGEETEKHRNLHQF